MTESPEQRPAVPGRFSRLRPLPPLPRWWPLPACVLLGAACGLSYGLLATPQYTATGYALAVTDKGADSAAALGFAQSYGRLATSDSTLGYARGAAGESVNELRSRVQVETSPDSPMIAVSGTSDSPRRAAEIANAVVEAIIVSGDHVAKDTGVKLIKFGHAITPEEPVSPSALLGTAVGGSAGGLLGGLALLVRPRPARRSSEAHVPAPATAQAAGQPVGADERELV